MKQEDQDHWEEIEGFASEFYRRVSSALPPVRSMQRDASLVRTTMTAFQIRPFKPVEISQLPIAVLGCECADPTFEYRWRGKVGSKCGWPGYEDANSRFLVRTVTEEYTGTQVGSGSETQISSGKLVSTNTTNTEAAYSSSYIQRFDPQTCRITCSDLGGESSYSFVNVNTYLFYADSGDPNLVTHERIFTYEFNCSGSPSIITTCTNSLGRRYADFRWSVIRNYIRDCQVTNSGTFPSTDPDCLCDNSFSFHTETSESLLGPCTLAGFPILVDTINSNTELTRTATINPGGSSSGTGHSGCFGNVDVADTTSSTITQTITETLTEENTTAMLKSNTYSALPDWDDEDWSDTPASSSAYLDNSETSYSLSEGEVRPLHSGPCYRKIWLRAAIVLSSDPGTTSYQDIGVYVYEDGADGDHVGPAYQIPIPTENGTATVQYKFICREGDPEPAWPE